MIIIPAANDSVLQLKEFAHQENPNPTEVENFVRGLAESATALDDFDVADLTKLETLVNGLSDDFSHKEKINQLIKQKFAEITSYSLVARYNTLVADAKTYEDAGYAVPAEVSGEKYFLERYAEDIVSAASGDAVSPENAVALSDYLEIAEKSPLSNESRDKLLAEAREKIDAALKEFDDINDLQRFEGMNPDEMDANEEAWFQTAYGMYGHTVTPENAEEFELFAGLAAQHFKDRVPTNDNLKEFSDELGDIQEQYHETLKTEIINQVAYNKFKANTGMSDEEIADLQLQGDAGLLEDQEQQNKYKQLIAAREKYLSLCFDVDTDSIGSVIVLDEIAEEDKEKAAKIAAISNKIKVGQELDDDEKALYNEYLMRADAKVTPEVVATATEATKVAFARQIENLASRTAKITGAKDITNTTRDILKRFATNHPKVWTYGKCIAAGGAKAALAWGIGAVAGVNGLAVYSAFNTYQKYRKAYNKYLGECQDDQKKNFKGFMEYLKNPENKDTKIELIRSLATTGIAVGFAVAGNMTGLSFIPGGKQIATAAVNLWANATKLVGKVKDVINKNPKTTKAGLWGIVAGTAIAATSVVVSLVTNSDTSDPTPDSPDPTPDTPAPTPENDVDVTATTGSGEHFDIDEAQKGIAEAGKIDQELTKEIDPLRMSYSQAHAPHISGGGHNISGGNSLETNENSESSSLVTHNNATTLNGNGNGHHIQQEETHTELPKEDVNYSFEQRSGGVFSHHKDTLDADGEEQFMGGTMKVTPRMEGETESEYNERLVRAANTDIAKNSELGGEEYHAKVTITKSNGDEIHVKQEVDYDNKNHIETIRRKIEVQNGDSYHSKTQAFRDEEGRVEHTEVKYRSHQVESETVGEAGGKSDKLLRETTVRGEDGVYRTGKIYKDGATGAKILRVTDKNGEQLQDDKIIDGVSSKKVMKQFIAEAQKVGGNSR